MFKELMCKLGIHYMQNHKHNFVDVVSRKTVYNTVCPCGKKWLVDTLSPITLFKVLK